MRFRIFISSVQSEFASARRQLAAMIRKDRWLSMFFDVFLFEETDAQSKSAQQVYLDAVADSDIYLGIVGNEYGNVDCEGVSPTEREFDKATELRRDRLEIINPGTLPKGTTREDLYRPHDSNPRNEIIAQAMSWTSYVEKSGNGTREIVRKCIGHGLAEPVFEPRAGFFHVIIWRKGYGPKFVGDKGPSQKGLVKGPSQKGLVKGPGQKGSVKGPRQMLLVIRSHSEISISGIADAYGKKSASGSMKRCLLALIEDGLVAPTRPQKRGSRLQTYRITAKGIKFLQQRVSHVQGEVL